MAFSEILLPERKCHKCIASQKQRWGCSENTATPLVIDDRELWRCPNRPLLDNQVFYNEFFRLIGWFEGGYFPEEGTWQDQSNVFIQCVEIWKAATNEANQIKDSRQRELKDKGTAYGNSLPKRNGVPNTI